MCFGSLKMRVCLVQFDSWKASQATFFVPHFASTRNFCLPSFPLWPYLFWTMWLIDSWNIVLKFWVYTHYCHNCTGNVTTINNNKTISLLNHYSSSNFFTKKHLLDTTSQPPWKMRPVPNPGNPYQAPKDGRQFFLKPQSLRLRVASTTRWFFPRNPGEDVAEDTISAFRLPKWKLFISCFFCWNDEFFEIELTI